MEPSRVIRPIMFNPLSVNQRLPSGPAIICSGELSESMGVGIVNSVMEPSGVMPPDLVAIRIGEPEIVVRAGCDRSGEVVGARVAGGRGRRELLDGAVGSDPPDLVKSA